MSKAATTCLILALLTVSQTATANDVKAEALSPITEYASDYPIGFTQAHDAAAGGEEERLSKYLQSGIDPNLQDAEKRTLLSYACQFGDVETVTLLIEAGANPELADVKGMTPLMYAARSGNTDAYLALVNAGANEGYSQHNQQGVTLLMYLSRGTSRPLLKRALLSDNLKLDEIDFRAATALYHAIDRSNDDAVRMLLIAGADPNQPGPGNLLPLDFAQQKFQEEYDKMGDFSKIYSGDVSSSKIIRILKTAGAKTQAQIDEEGEALNSFY